MQLASGGGVCFIGVSVGDPCGAGQWGCANGLVCSGGSCQFPTSGLVCPRADGGCGLGDDCYNALVAAINSGSGNDPCFVGGLDCVQSATSYICNQPEVLPPPYFPLLEISQDYSICDPTQSLCTPYPGDPAATGCGTVYFEALNAQQKIIAAPAPVCEERCQQPDDCGSLAQDCIGGFCVPNYCYAQPDQTGLDVAALLTTALGVPVSSDAGVLFQPCAHGGPNTLCLPQNDNGWNTTTGVCYRVGGPDAGGVGASCDPAAPRTNQGALCREGTFCMKGTCYPWCDTGGSIPCSGSQTCVPVQGALISSTANPHGAGVCLDNCNLYQDAAHNGCPAAPCGSPQALCKPSGVDSDVFPVPGICVGGPAAPVAVGQSCDPYGRVDPCVSGAVCSVTLAGTSFVCAQVCDPAPSPAVENTTPSCPAPAACHGVGAPLCTNAVSGGACKHVGVCL
jgi:hypothetical protein